MAGKSHHLPSYNPFALKPLRQKMAIGQQNRKNPSVRTHARDKEKPVFKEGVSVFCNTRQMTKSQNIHSNHFFSENQFACFILFTKFVRLS